MQEMTIEKKDPSRKILFRRINVVIGGALVLLAITHSFQDQISLMNILSLTLSGVYFGLTVAKFIKK